MVRVYRRFLLNSVNLTHYASEFPGCFDRRQKGDDLSSFGRLLHLFSSLGYVELKA